MDDVFTHKDGRSRGMVSTILVAGLVAGILDGVAASVQFYVMTGRSPARVFQYISSAVMGPAAFTGGLKTVVLGVLFHLVIAIAFAAIFYSMYPLLKRRLRNPIVIGCIYGIAVWLMMNFAVLPLTKVARGPLAIKSVLIGITILILMVGIPISLIVGRHRKMVSATHA